MAAWVRALEAVKILAESPEATLPSLIGSLADTHEDRLALLDEEDRLSYRALAARVNGVARWGMRQGFARKDVICLLMPNCADYVTTWLGLSRIGCVSALINTNLTSDSLIHSVQAAGSTNIIVGADLLPTLAAVLERLSPGTRVWVHGPAPAGDRECFEPACGAVLSAEERAFPRPDDPALLIYTSGTTGLPKAARVTHGRVLEWSFWFAGMMDATPADRLYDCLPLYHSTGGVVAIGAMLVSGGSVLIRRRFSARRFWDDVVEGECTIFQYIGELCRYLVNAAPHPREREHRLRLACGNGLQGDIWAAFARRFEVPRILEFYAATEGNVSLYNCEEKPGAIGRVPPFLARQFPVRLIRCDPETGVAVRDADGRCVVCGPDEVGEAVGQVLDATRSPARRFDGYTDRAASARKLLHDAFAAGDCWFRTGDLMRRDTAGFFYFVDRMGDTFRWKGENVASTEVAAVLRACPAVTDAVVYGVAVPGHEGRAGMAAITADGWLNLDTLRRHITERLPDYARPLFVRICPALDVTGTFKLAKSRLIAEGFAAASDQVWFNDRAAGCFVTCDPALVRAIADGETRL